MNLDYFIPIKDHMNYVQTKAAYKNIDINEMIRCLYAQSAIENKETMSESLTKTPFQEELQVMLHLRNNKTYSLNDIDADDKIKGTSIPVSSHIFRSETVMEVPLILSSASILFNE